MRAVTPAPHPRINVFFGLTLSEHGDTFLTNYLEIAKRVRILQKALEARRAKE